MSTLDQDIKDSISKNLPAQVGNVLRQRLAQADIDADLLNSARDELSTLRDKHEDLHKTCTTLKTEVAKHEALDKRLADICESERNLKLAAAEVELAAEKRITATLTDVLSKLVRNTDYRTTVFGNENIPVQGNPGGNGAYPTPGSVVPMPVNRTTTQTQE